MWPQCTTYHFAMNTLISPLHAPTLVIFQAIARARSAIHWNLQPNARPAPTATHIHTHTHTYTLTQTHKRAHT